MLYLLLAFIGLCAALLLLLVLRPGLTKGRGGKILAFLAIFILPLLAGSMGVSEHVEHSKRTEFCLSCHIMEPYGKSLYVDSKDVVPAAHFQNARIPREQACFTCHTTYTLFGDYKAKLKGLRHIYIAYLGKSPYNNRECLHCHAGARSFEEHKIHNKGDNMEQIKSNQLSCLDSGCHDTIHGVKDLKDQKFWNRPQS
jgi:nitrate/TMAO reductase-like tetraheme cytochrome c subunit